MVEGRYWSCGVGGLWGFKGGWPGRLERSRASERGVGGTVGPPAGSRAGRLGYELGQPSCPEPLGGALGSPALALWPSPAWPPPHPARVSHIFSFPLLRPLPFFLARLPLPLCCPLSQSGPALCRPRASHHLDQMGRCQRPMGKASPTARCPQSPASSRVGTAPVGTLCPGSPAKAAQADRGPSPP